MENNYGLLINPNGFSGMLFDYDRPCKYDAFLRRYIPAKAANRNPAIAFPLWIPDKTCRSFRNAGEKKWNLENIRQDPEQICSTKAET
jgi:hypothetical protein